MNLDEERFSSAFAGFILGLWCGFAIGIIAMVAGLWRLLR